MKKIFTLILISILVFSCDDDDAYNPIISEDDFSEELFFSEYIEGTSFNKALEIVNLTGSAIDLEELGYSIKKQSNGTGNWIATLPLTGILTHNDVYVIGNANADIPEIINNAHLLKTGAPMDFNGNDPIGLFRNDVLIDVIGEIDNPEDFGKDVTLRRRIEVTEPGIVYDPGQWEVYETNNVQDLGYYYSRQNQ